MNEGAQMSGGSEAVTEGSTKATGMSAGAMLRHLRESAGVDATLVANALKVSLQTLQALEEDRYQALPDMAFARGMASSICRNFGVDPAPVLAQMPPALTTELAMSANTINAPFYNPSDRPAALLPKYVSRPLTVVVALFLLGSLLLWLWPTLPVRLGDADVPTSARGDSSVAEVREQAQAEAPMVVTVPLPTTESSPVDDAPIADDEADAVGAGEGATALLSAEFGAQTASPDADATAPAVGEGSSTSDDAADMNAGAAGTDGVETEGVETEGAGSDDAGSGDSNDVDDAPAAAGDAEAAAAAGEDLVIAASDESWVSVRDRSGKTLFNRLLEKGETARISGDKPLSTTIGRKNAVSVLVHGEPFDHRALGSSSVARFKVE